MKMTIKCKKYTLRNQRNLSFQEETVNIYQRDLNHQMGQ
jgi:hypothetical protein